MLEWRSYAFLKSGKKFDSMRSTIIRFVFYEFFANGKKFEGETHGNGKEKGIVYC